MVARLDGLGEYDVRRPLVPSGPTCSASSSTSPPWSSATSGTAWAGRRRGAPWVEDGSVWESAEMWATPDEARAASSTSIGRRGGTPTNRRDAAPRRPAEVPWWPDDRRATTFGSLLVRMVAETAQHAGHADILRETVDGANGAELDPGAQAAFATASRRPPTHSATGLRRPGGASARPATTSPSPDSPGARRHGEHPGRVREVAGRPDARRGPAVDHPRASAANRYESASGTASTCVRASSGRSRLINQRAASRWRSRSSRSARPVRGEERRVLAVDPLDHGEAAGCARTRWRR